MPVELELKHIDQWSLERLLEAPAAAETFVLARGINREPAIAHLRRRSPEDYERVASHLPRLLSEWNEPSPDLHETLDLAKSWHSLRAALEECSAQGLAVSTEFLTGGRPLGPDLGIGPLRYFTPEEVAAHAAALATVSLEQMRTWVSREEMLAEAEDMLARVTRYYHFAQERHRAMLLRYQ